MFPLQIETRKDSYLIRTRGTQRLTPYSVGSCYQSHSTNAHSNKETSPSAHYQRWLQPVECQVGRIGLLKWRSVSAAARPDNTASVSTVFLKGLNTTANKNSSDRQGPSAASQRPFRPFLQTVLLGPLYLPAQHHQQDDPHDLITDL